VRPRGHWSEWFQRHEEFCEKRTVRIGAVLTATLLGKHRPHRIVAPDDVADPRNGLHAAFERDGGRHHPANPKVAFFQLWQELGSQPRAEQATNCKECYRESWQTDRNSGRRVARHADRVYGVVVP